MSGYFGVPPAAAYSMVPQAAYPTPAVPGMIPTVQAALPTVQAALPTVQAYAPAAGIMTATPYAAAPTAYQAPVVAPAVPQYQQAVDPVAAYQMPPGQVYTAPAVVNVQMQNAWQQQAVVAPNYQQPQQPQMQQRSPVYSATNLTAQQPRQKAPITTRLGVTGVNLNNLKPLGSQPEEQPKQQQHQQPAQRQQQQQFQQRATSSLGVQPNIVGNAGNKQQQVFNKQQQQSQYKQQQHHRPQYQQQQPFKRPGFPPRPFNSPTVSGHSLRGGRQPFRPGERRPFGSGPAAQQQQQQHHGRKQQQQPGNKQSVGNDGDELIDAPPIGYEYIEELRVPDSHNRGGLNRFTVQYRCKLCDCRFTDPQAKEMHVKGRRHRMQFKKKVDPNLEVDAKPSAKARRAHEEKQRQPTADWIKRQEASVPEMHAMEMSNYIGMRAPAGVYSPAHSAGRHRIESNDDRHAIAKHSSVYPTEDELRSVQSLVSRCEKALKLVSDSLTDEYDSSVLKGVMRVGVLAKGLLLHGDLATNLVLLCADAPTESLLKRIYQLMPATLNGDTDEEEDEEVKEEKKDKSEELVKKEEMSEEAKNEDTNVEETDTRDKKNEEIEKGDKKEEETKEEDKNDNESEKGDKKDEEMEGEKDEKELKEGDKKIKEVEEDKKDEGVEEVDKKDKEIEDEYKNDGGIEERDEKDEEIKKGGSKDDDMEEGDKKDNEIEDEDKKDEDMEEGDKKDNEIEDEDKKDEDMEEGDKKDKEMEDEDKKDEDMEGDKKDKEMEGGKKDEDMEEVDKEIEGGKKDEEMEDEDKKKRDELKMDVDSKQVEEIKEADNCDEEMKCEGKKDQEIIKGDKKEEKIDAKAEQDRLVFEKKEDDRKKNQAKAKKSRPPLITKLDEEESAIIIECPISEATCTVTLTSPVVREPQTDDKPEPADPLDKEKCLEALASVRHAKWFQAKASGMSTCLIVTRLLRDLCQRVPTWSPFPEWAMELIVERCASSCRAEFPSPGDCIRRVFECLAAGLILPGGPGVRDPCEKEPTDACATLTVQEREDITASAQHALRLIAFRQLHKVLDMDRLTPIGVKRRAEPADSAEAAKVARS